MKQLTIEHNHGVVVLQDAELFTPAGNYQHAKGICIGGGETSRLFSATSHKEFKTGVEMTYPCWSQPWCCDAEKDHWRASIVTC